MPTLNKLEYLDETKQEIKGALNTKFNSGITDEDTFRSYVDKIKNIYINWPRVTGENTELTLEPTRKGKMEIGLKPSELSQDAEPSPSNPQQIHVISGENNVYIQNNNYFDGELELGSFNSSGAKIDSTVHVRSKNFIPVQPNTTYRFSENNTGIALYIHQYDKTYNFLERTLRNAQETFTTREDCYYIAFRNYNENPDTSLKIMMAKGSNIQPYIQGKIQSLPLSLGDLEYCKIGDYEDLFFKNVVGSDYYDSTLVEDKWYLKKKIGKAQVSLGNSVYDVGNLKGATFLPSPTKINSILDRAYCSKSLISISALDRAENRFYENPANFMFIGSATDTATTLKEKFNGSDFYYVLATPTYTLLSDTLQTQLDNIANALSYDEQTNISQTNDDLPFIISASALMKGGN